MNKWVLNVIILVVSYLMVSTLPLLALKFKDRTVKGNLPAIILVLIAIVSALIFQWLAVPVVFICYIILSLAFKNK